MGLCILKIREVNSQKRWNISDKSGEFRKLEMDTDSEGRNPNANIV